MTVAISSIGSGRMAIDITGVASVAAAGQGEIANQEGCDVHIVRAHLLVKTVATVAGELSIGVKATGVKGTDVWTTTAMDGQTEGSVYECFADPGALTVLPTAVWASDEFLTFSGDTLSLAGFTGTLFLEYLRTPPE